MIDQKGLAWVPTIWGSEPKWTIEPSSAAVAEAAHRHLNLSDAEVAGASIDFLNQGAFNKLYTITCSRGVFIMRVTLPVDPGYKTASEAATIELLRRRTSIPVPRVLGYDMSPDNLIGFEWMLMDRVAGVTLDKAWLQIPWAAKTTLVNRIVDVHAQMFRTRSNAIGNVFRTPDLERLQPCTPPLPLSP